MTKNIGIALLTCTLLTGISQPTAAQTPDAKECKSYVDSVFDQAEREDVNQTDILQYIVITARLGRECYGERRPDRIVWLLNNEVFVLDLLGRYDEASALVSLFFDEYFEGASDLFKGRMYQWHLQYLVYDGRYEDAAKAYGEALRYDGALTLARRAALRNDGAFLLIRSGDFGGAARRASEGIALLDSTYRLRDEGIELTKLLQNRGHARLERYDDDSTAALLDPARRDLHAAIALRDSMGFSERQAEAYVTLGEIYHRLGDDQAGRGYMGTGLRLARTGGNSRGEIFALWRTGRMSRRGGMSSLARQQLQEALRLSEESAIGEFELLIQLELGRLFEDGGAWKRAEGFYRAVAEAPDEDRYRSSLYDEAKARDEAERRGMNARLHLAEAKASWLRLVLFGLVLMILFLGGGTAWLWRRGLRRGLPPAPPPSLADSISALPDLSGDDLLDNRTRHLTEILMREDPPHNTALYRRLAEEETGVNFRGDPANTYASYFRGRLGDLGIPYPKTPDEWRRLLSLPV